jgi:hypothetical protein
MFASRVTGLRSLVVLLIAAVAITAFRAWPGLPAAPVAEVAPMAEVAPAADWETPEAPAEPVQTCLLLAHPNWGLRITNVVSRCPGKDILGDFTITSSGEVTWTKPGRPVRHFALWSERLELVRRLEQLSCVALKMAPHGGELLSIRLDLGQHYAYTEAHIARNTLIGHRVTEMLDEIVAPYRGPRREAIGPIDLSLTTSEFGAVYDVRIDCDRLTVKHGRKLLVDEEVEADALVDLVDWALESYTGTGDDVVVGCACGWRAVDGPDVRGVLRVNGRNVRVTFPRHASGPFDLINRAIYRAQVIAAAGS